MAAELGGEAAAGLGGERDRGHDRSQFAGVHQRGDDARRRSEAQQVKEVVALDGHQSTGDDAEDDHDAGGTATHDEGAVAPRDIGEVPQELFPVVAQHDWNTGDGPEEERDHVAQPGDRFLDPVVDADEGPCNRGYIS